MRGKFESCRRGIKKTAATRGSSRRDQRPSFSVSVFPTNLGPRARLFRSRFKIENLLRCQTDLGGFYRILDMGRFRYADNGDGSFGYGPSYGHLRSGRIVLAADVSHEPDEAFQLGEHIRIKGPTSSSTAWKRMLRAVFVG